MKKGRNPAINSACKSENFRPKAGKNKPIFMVKKLSS